MSTEKVSGYTTQSQERVKQVNLNKMMEERLLRELDQLRQSGCDGPVDQRWIAIAGTHFQEGFMAMNRAIFQPRRLSDQEVREMTASDNPLAVQP